MKSVAFTLWEALLHEPKFKRHIYGCARCNNYRRSLKGVIALNEAYIDMVTAHLLAEAQSYGIQLDQARLFT